MSNVRLRMLALKYYSLCKHLMLKRMFIRKTRNENFFCMFKRKIRIQPLLFTNKSDFNSISEIQFKRNKNIELRNCRIETI